VHAVGLLNAPKDEVTNVKGGFLDIVVVISSKLLIMMGLSHDGNKSLFFEAIKVDAPCLLGLSFLVELDAWSSKGDIGR
jgi:multisubunit Na+/H+ antiporter MnhB subunit